MAIVILLATAFLLAFSNTSAYQFVSSCNPGNSSCISLTCTGHSKQFIVPVAKHPYQYQCCYGDVYDAFDYGCYGSKGIRVCSDNERCNGNKLCLKMPGLKCDGRNDCIDGSDESRCYRCSSQQFRCRNYQCIPLAHVCDGDNDCSDGSDEAGCYRKGVLCAVNEFICKDNSKCIEDGSVCNGIKDCKDGSDELHCGPKQAFGR